MKRSPMKKRAGMAVFLLLTILLSFSLVSCEDLLTPSGRRSHVMVDDFMVRTPNRGGAGQTMAEMPGFSGVPEEVSGEVMITSDTTGAGKTVKRVYNLTTAKLLFQAEEVQQCGFISSLLNSPENAEGIFYVTNNDIVHIYNSDGSEAVSAFYDSGKSGRLPVTDTLNGFGLDGVEYYVKDGFVIFDGRDPLESDYFSASVEYNGRFYYLSDKQVFVFGEKGTLTYEYTLPSYAQEANIFVLSNGNIFIQYVYKAMEEEVYDYVRNETRYKVVSILSNLSKNTESIQELPFLVKELENAFTDPDFHEYYTARVANLAQVVTIRDKRIDDNQTTGYTVLSDTLVELYSISDVVKGAWEINRISEDRNLASTAAGEILVDGNSHLVGQLNNYRAITEKYIVTAGRIYDHDLNVIYDMADKGYTYFASVGDNLLLSMVIDESAMLYLYQGSEPRFICAMENYVSCYEGYAVRSGDIYHYYDETGKMLTPAAGRIEWIYAHTDKDVVTAIGYATDSHGRVSYYRLSYTEVLP